MKPGSKVTFREAADQAPGAEPGDVIVILLEKHDPSRDQEAKEGKHKKPRVSKTTEVPRPSFQRLRDSSDLTMEYDITLVEALLGFEIAFKHLDDRLIVVKSPEGKVINPNELVVVEHEGMPLEKNPSLMGDLYIKLNIIMPTAKELGDESVRKQLAAILPKPAPIPESVVKNPDASHYTASPFDPDVQNQRNRARNSRNHNHDSTMEDDDDEPGVQTAQCRQS